MRAPSSYVGERGAELARPGLRGALGSVGSWRAPRRARAGERCPRTSRGSRGPRHCRPSSIRASIRSTVNRVGAGLGDRLRASERERRLEVRDGVLRRPERELELTERLRGEKRHVVVAALLERAAGLPASPASGRPSCAWTRPSRARLCLAKRRCPDCSAASLSRRGRERARSRGCREGAPRRREGTGATAERSRRPGRARVASGRRATARARSCESAHFQYSASATSGWSRTRRSAAESCSAAACSAVAFAVAPAKQRFRREPGQEDVRGERLVVHLQREGQSDRGVPQHLVETLEHPETARGGAFVGDGERQRDRPRASSTTWAKRSAASSGAS